MTPDDILCFPESEAAAHQFLNDAVERARLLVCAAPVTRPSAAVYPDDNTYVLRVPEKTGYRFRLTDQLGDYRDGEPGADRVAVESRHVHRWQDLSDRVKRGAGSPGSADR